MTELSGLRFRPNADLGPFVSLKDISIHIILVLLLYEYKDKEV